MVHDAGGGQGGCHPFMWPPHLSRGVLRHKAVVVNCVDVAFFGHHVSEAATCRVFVADAPGLVPQNALNIIPGAHKTVVDSDSRAAHSSET